MDAKKLLVMFIVIVAIIFIPALAQAETLQVYGEPTKTLDGIISPGEYSGACTATFATWDGNATVYLAADGANLWIAFSLPGLGVGHGARVAIDTSNDRGLTPQSDDFEFRRQRDGSTAEAVGDGNLWTGSPTPGGWSSASSGDISSWSTEFKISYSKIGITAGSSRTISIYLADTILTQDRSWPTVASFIQPYTWARLSSPDSWQVTYPTISSLSLVKGKALVSIYSRGSPTFTWNTTDTAGVSGYSYILDRTSGTNPDTASEGTATSKAYSGLANGRWYFHLRAVDSLVNWGQTRHLAINVDRYKPKTKAPKYATVPRGSIAKLYYKVTDPWSPKAKVTIKITQFNKKVVRVINLGLKKTGKLSYYRFKANLKKGVYKFNIYAKDLAGNSQHNSDRKYLIIY